MALWLVRAGKYGEHEARFIEQNLVCLTFSDLVDENLTGIADYEGIKEVVQRLNPNSTIRQVGNYAGQIWAFALDMKIGDWVVLPRKESATIAIGQVTRPYQYRAGEDSLYRHVRTITWLNTAIPRASFDQDLLYSFGAFLTVCQIQRNDAELRVRAMQGRGWTSAPPAPVGVVVNAANPESGMDDDATVDLELLARDSIARLIIQKFQGHGLARLVAAILKSQGLTTHLSPEGPDGGIDILAAGGSFGFQSPKICVQVKSGDAQADRPEFTQLIGAMQNVHADQGLFVSWSGFKQTVMREVPTQFFKVRLWNQNDLIDQILANYDKLDPDIRAELPLKRIWTIATPDA